MINFSSTPPDDTRGYGLDLLRTPATTPIVAAVTSTNLIGCATHFWGGRTVPHDEDDCEACLNGVPWRWHDYLGAIDHRNGLHFLFETTRKAAEPFREWFRQHGTLRGAKFEARRPTHRPNGRVVIRLKSIDLIEFPLPKEPNVIRLLSILWNIPLADLSQGTTSKGSPAIAADRGVTALATEWAKRQKRDPKAPPPVKPNGELLSTAEAEEVAEALAKVIDGNGRGRPATIPTVPA